MAARKKNAEKTRKARGGGAKTIAKSTAPKKSASSSKTSKPARGPTRSAPAEPSAKKTAKSAPKKVTTPSAEVRAPVSPALGRARALARHMVERAGAKKSGRLDEFYAEDCTVHWPGSGPIACGLAEIASARERWRKAVAKERWNARSVLVSEDRICIEWSADVELGDGRRLSLEEVAVYEIVDDRIHAERHYYDPTRLAATEPPKSGSTPAGSGGMTRPGASKTTTPVARNPADPPAPPDVPPRNITGSPPLDPLDL